MCFKLRPPTATPSSLTNFVDVPSQENLQEVCIRFAVGHPAGCWAAGVGVHFGASSGVCRVYFLDFMRTGL